MFSIEFSFALYRPSKILALHVDPLELINILIMALLQYSSYPLRYADFILNIVWCSKYLTKYKERKLWLFVV
jgi:hypothetical protein